MILNFLKLLIVKLHAKFKFKRSELKAHKIGSIGFYNNEMKRKKMGSKWNKPVAAQ